MPVVEPANLQQRLELANKSRNTLSLEESK